MHPLVLHTGTTNYSSRARLMANGMVRVKADAFKRAGACFVHGDSFAFAAATSPASRWQTARTWPLCTISYAPCTTLHSAFFLTNELSLLAPACPSSGRIPFQSEMWSTVEQQRRQARQERERQVAGGDMQPPVPAVPKFPFNHTRFCYARTALYNVVQLRTTPE
jgi:hypothetical protein